MRPVPVVHVALLTLVLAPVLEVRNGGDEVMQAVEVEVRDAATGAVHDDLLHASRWWGIMPGSAVEFPLRRVPFASLEVHLSWLDAAGVPHVYRCVIEETRRSAEAPCVVPDESAPDHA